MNIVENIYANNGALVHKDNRRNHPVAEAVKSPYLRKERTSYPNVLRQIMRPISFIIVLIGPTLLISDGFRIFSLFMVNITLGAIFGFIKYGFGTSKIG